MLTLRRVPIDSGREFVAYLHRDCTIYPADEFPPLSRIEIAADGRALIARLNVVEAGLLGTNELGLGPAAFEALGATEGAALTIAHQKRLPSLDALRRKVAGDELDDGSVDAIVADMVANRYGEEEVAAFLVAASRQLSEGEVAAFARARARHVPRLAWDAPIVVDKHSMGGVPGNRVTMVVIPIVAAHGLTIPKTSSRAITSPAGTADCMEVLARVDLGPDEVAEVVARTNGCIVWNGRLNHSPLDDVMNRITRPLGLDTRQWSVASILSKKLSAGSTHVMIDLPVGPAAKLRSDSEAQALAGLFVAVGNGLGLAVHTCITDGTRPIGNGIGPVLEARDVMAVLANDARAPDDLRQKALDFAGRILAFDPGVADGRARAAELLETGAAHAAMDRIIEAQGAPPVAVGLGPLVHEVPAPRDGAVTAMDCYRIAGIARAAGAPMDKGAGIDLLRKVGDRVRAGEPLYRIHAHIDGDFRAAVAMAEEDPGVRPGRART